MNDKVQKADEVFNEGLSAYRNGQGKQSNPYSHSDAEHDWWEKGWNFGAETETTIPC